ncbi:MAG: hypothetical protein ACRDKX_07790 [Solirubrobacterales bacterium]
MDTSRLRTGELIAGVAAVALFIIMFLPWFGFDVGGGEVAEDLGIAVPEVSADFNAWESFDFIDLVLLLTIIVAVGLAVATAMAQTVSLPVAASALTAGLGILSTILVLYRIINPPGEADREFWVFVGLIAAGAIAYGGWRSMQEEGTSFGAQADRLQDRTGGPSDRPPPPPPPPPPSGTAGGPPPPPGGAA